MFFLFFLFLFFSSALLLKDRDGRPEVYIAKDSDTLTTGIAGSGWLYIEHVAVHITKHHSGYVLAADRVVGRHLGAWVRLMAEDALLDAVQLRGRCVDVFVLGDVRGPLQRQDEFLGAL